MPEPRGGPLRPVVTRTVAAFLDCGRLVNGFARIRCPSCGGEHLLAFSCQTRNICPSCQSKRAVRFAEKFLEEIAAPVPHRHLVFAVPKALRGLFQRERPLLGLLARRAYDAIRRADGAGAKHACRAWPGCGGAEIGGVNRAGHHLGGDAAPAEACDPHGKVLLFAGR